MGTRVVGCLVCVGMGFTIKTMLFVFDHVVYTKMYNLKIQGPSFICSFLFSFDTTNCNGSLVRGCH